MPVTTFIHEQELEEFKQKGFNYNQLPKSIQVQIMNFNRSKNAFEALEDGPQKDDQYSSLRKKSIIIADDIQTFVEKDLPDDDEEIQNQNSMNEELVKRAQAVGLPDTATEQEIVAAEQAKADGEAAKALIVRAKEVGLAEDATLEQIEAAEKAKEEGQDEASKAAAKAKADKEAQEKAEADAKAKAAQKYNPMEAFNIFD